MELIKDFIHNLLFLRFWGVAFFEGPRCVPPPPPPVSSHRRAAWVTLSIHTLLSPRVTVSSHVESFFDRHNIVPSEGPSALRHNPVFDVTTLAPMCIRHIKVRFTKSGQRGAGSGRWIAPSVGSATKPQCHFEPNQLVCWGEGEVDGFALGQAHRCPRLAVAPPAAAAAAEWGTCPWAVDPAQQRYYDVRCVTLRVPLDYSNAGPAGAANHKYGIGPKPLHRLPMHS